MRPQDKLFLSIGECMVELSPLDQGTYSMAYAGDTFNTIWYAKRHFPASWQFSYLTRVGMDAVSDGMVEFIRDAGISTNHITRIDGKTTGLYMIHLKNGERSFSYWRNSSAARDLANDPGLLNRAMKSAGAIYFSGITMAVLPKHGRDNLISALSRARRDNRRIIFDPNLRPALWPDLDTMRHEIGRAASVADIVLPSFDDEACHFGDTCLTDTIERYRDLGARLVVVKNGGDIVLAADCAGKSYSHTPESLQNPVDTTAAGDAFNAAFLATYLNGANIQAALASGCDLSLVTVQKRGALVDVNHR
ncbi:MAG: sugar kinase [Rhodobacteraceae bacterium]|nr:sugar kinase [Paracoccaceae bacterium]